MTQYFCVYKELLAPFIVNQFIPHTYVHFRSRQVMSPETLQHASSLQMFPNSKHCRQHLCTHLSTSVAPNQNRCSPKRQRTPGKAKIQARIERSILRRRGKTSTANLAAAIGTAIPRYTPPLIQCNRAQSETIRRHYLCHRTNNRPNLTSLLRF